MIDRWLKEEKRLKTNYSEFAVIDLTENEAANSVINIYNIKGQLIYTFNHLQAGKNNVLWNGKDRYNKFGYSLYSEKPVQ